MGARTISDDVTIFVRVSSETLSSNIVELGQRGPPLSSDSAKVNAHYWLDSPTQRAALEIIKHMIKLLHMGALSHLHL